MPISIMAKNYLNCPLKKRPIVFEDVSDEPENLSTKPEDLSRTGRLASVSPVSSPQSSPDSRLSPVSSISIHSPPSSPQNSPPSPTHFYHEPQVKVETPLAVYSAPISPEYAPQTWHRSVAPIYHPAAYYPVAYHPYHHEPVYMPPNSPYSESSLSPPHHLNQPLQPLALRPTVYSTMDQSSLSPSSSTHSPPPQPMALGSAEDLTQDKRKQQIRHQCPACGKSYSTFSGLSKHRQFHCAAGDGPKKSFSCKYCEKVYVSLGALKMHIRTHTLPCKCTICGKAFSRPWLLQGHIRTHTGEKPFSCTYCNRAFADRSNLRAHLQTHSDVKKYSCTTCSKTFSRMSLLTKHTEGGCTGSNPGLLHSTSMDKMY
ncbi:zinc finger protein SNAI2-like [Anthonomus grandis grandis]|uniref:zinc finger protein SNAI2-like n=1 Tax=Anthonomus grandis grandis TaxID=2921223 RepID=UPI0021651659|nr:zinc finger protein SNAI2-like [Anthonomus grandis grandis]